MLAEIEILFTQNIKAVTYEEKMIKICDFLINSV